MVDKVDKGELVEKVDKEELVTAKISQKNHKELIKIAGLLQSSSGEIQSVDDAITHLIVNHRRDKTS